MRDEGITSSLVSSLSLTAYLKTRLHETQVGVNRGAYACRHQQTILQS